MVEIAPGVPIFILDAHGTEHPAIACSGITKSHPRGFPIVWVTGEVFRDDNPVPWPAENVRAAEEVTGDGTGTVLPPACDHWAHTATDGIPRGSKHQLGARRVRGVHAAPAGVRQGAATGGEARAVADTTEMIRLMRHAADLLKAADPTPDYLTLIYEQRNVPARDRSVLKLSQVIAAMTYARVLLDTVAAAMGDEPDRAAAAGTDTAEGEA